MKLSRCATVGASALISLLWLRIPKAVVATEKPAVVPAQ